KSVQFMMGLYQAFVDKDCSMAEINPLVTTGDGEVLALDAKLNFDESALYRQREVEELRDFDEEDEKEIEASKYDLSYIDIDEKISCMVKFVGIALDKMITIRYYKDDAAKLQDVVE